jgi:hypothetical protein
MHYTIDGILLMSGLGSVCLILFSIIDLDMGSGYLMM